MDSASLILRSSSICCLRTSRDVLFFVASSMKQMREIPPVAANVAAKPDLYVWNSPSSSIPPQASGIQDSKASAPWYMQVRNPILARPRNIRCKRFSRFESAVDKRVGLSPRNARVMYTESATKVAELPTLIKPRKASLIASRNSIVDVQPSDIPMTSALLGRSWT